MSTLRELKLALRKDVRRTLSLLSPAIVSTESDRITAALLSWPPLQRSSRVSVYISKEGAPEASTDAIIAALLKAGKSLYIPRCVDSTTMEMVRLRDEKDLAGLPRNRMGIREPALDEAREEGRGYYDRYLARCHELDRSAGRKPTPTIALALSAQIIESDIPRDEHDLRPDFLLSSDGLLDLPPL
ncbi:hypothetical protein HK101_000395 [Irineochytrium annulatum]|nr:hypothetical protein HK101_000395 [Irineochytrium annulatum]